MRKNKLAIFVLLSICLLLTSCKGEKSDDHQEFVNKTGFYLDTVVDIRIYEPDENTDDVFQKCFDRISLLENTLSVHIEGSDLYKVEESAGIEPVKVSDETYFVINKSIHYSEISQGHFDITTGPLINLWAIDPPEGHVPTQKELDEVLPKIDYKKIVLDKDNSTVMLKDEGMIANLGAIAKGYIADEIKKVLIDNGVEHAIINLGGNVLLVGDKPEGSKFSIGVQDPDSARGAYVGIVKISDESLVTSGDYERYFIQDGVRYHHILDPFTGFPADNELRQVTIISPQSIDGDALSTTTFLMGLENGMELIEQIPDIEAIFVTKDKKIYLTSGLKDKFEFDEENYKDVYEVVK